ncbi:MAG: ABC transporter permease [Flavobacteriales bacterium]|nr:ABC transporter permease [Flavobacteriales bacterium]
MELLKEIYSTLIRNPLRSFLTAFGVSWGIFMLIICLGLGQGLENGVRQMFAGFSGNNMFVWGQSTSLPYAGFTEGRRVQLKMDDVDLIRAKIKGLKIVAPRTQLGGYGEGNNVKYNNESGAFSIHGDIPDVRKIYMWEQMQGRFINEIDYKYARKVCTIGKRVKEVLFKDENPIGKYISANGISFMVVGVHKSPSSGEMAERDEQQIIVPISTYQKAFDGSNNINWMAIQCEDDVNSQKIQEEIINLLRPKHKVHPDDPRGFGSFNTQERFGPMQMTFLTVRALAWFVGIMTLFAGIIGVSNIMLVTVKERTKEIGIRRAIGARPRNILIQILLEAVALTFFAGYIGLMAGIWLVEILGRSGASGQMFKNPEVPFYVAVTALFVLIFSGAIAGLLPASKALKIKPVEALRYE